MMAHIYATQNWLRITFYNVYYFYKVVANAFPCKVYMANQQLKFTYMYMRPKFL